ncbi:MAG: hypothetical protein FWD03_04360 [Defluviitaleaceae bacterium]|nr:hypothetical protein [Defluviitaleaceae bacterium]
MKKPFVAGIAGGSASGKSTFTDRLENTLRETGRYEIKVFHMDDYFKDDDHRPYVKAPITGKMYLDDNHPESIDLPQLRIDLAAAINDNTADIIIVEGLLTLSDDEICQQLDLKLFIECRADERIVRRLKRNMEWDMSFDEIADVYLDMVRYRHDEYVEPSKWKADFILNGSNFSEKALGMIAEAIMSHTLHA